MGVHDQAIKWGQDAISAIKAGKAETAISLIKRIIAHEQNQGKEAEEPKTEGGHEMARNVFDELARFASKGNPEALIEYWRSGPGHDRINWEDTEGNLTRCHELLSKYIDSEAAWGFCQNRHIEIFGEPNATTDARRESASTENVTELSESGEDESSVTLGNNADLKTKGEHQERRKCAMCGKSYLGQKNSSTCGDACRKAKSRKG